MAHETLRTEIEDGVLTITLDRPDRMNAFNKVMHRELLAALSAAQDDDAVRVIIMTGAGRAFCAGMDLGSGGSTFDSSSRRTAEQHRDEGGQVVLEIFRSLKPVIGALNGAAVGVGITMCLPMDIRIAAEGAKMGFVFARRGIVTEACSSWFLPRVVGIAQAMEWVSTGRVFSAREALDGGLVSRVVPADELLPTARALAREIADHTSAVAVALSRQMLWRMMGASHPLEAHRIDSRGIYEMGRSPDAKEGVESFLEKRPARFPMRISEDMPSFYPWWTDEEF